MRYRYFLRQLVERAEKFPHRRIDAISTTKRKLLEERTISLEAVESETKAIAEELDDLEKKVSSYGTELDGGKRDYDTLMDNVSASQQVIADLKLRLKGDPVDLERYRTQRDSIKSTTEVL